LSGFVLDASITLSWYFADEADAAADRAFSCLGADGAVVPALWWFEVRNALLTSERRGRLKAAQTAEILAHLVTLPILLDRSPGSGTILVLARTHRLTVYDAAYLELASRLGLPLATLDRPLALAARAAAVALLDGVSGS
jgi:predicted nucleic acid-binding protein